jgi:hypothetical protein
MYENVKKIVTVTADLKSLLSLTAYSDWCVGLFVCTELQRCTLHGGWHANRARGILCLLWVGVNMPDCLACSSSLN